MKCIFEVLSRAKKTTKKIDSEKDLVGFDTLLPADQAQLRAYISGKIKVLPPPKVAKAKGTLPAPSSPVAHPSSPTPAVPGIPYTLASTGN